MLNQITIMGRLVRDPELRNAGQHRVVNFTLAVDRDYGGDDRETDFVDIVAWNAQADFVSKFFSQGPDGHRGRQAGKQQVGGR